MAIITINPTEMRLYAPSKSLPITSQMDVNNRLSTKTSFTYSSICIVSCRTFPVQISGSNLFTFSGYSASITNPTYTNTTITILVIIVITSTPYKIPQYICNPTYINVAMIPTASQTAFAVVKSSFLIRTPCLSSACEFWAAGTTLRVKKFFHTPPSLPLSDKMFFIFCTFYKNTTFFLFHKVFFTIQSKTINEPAHS